MVDTLPRTERETLYQSSLLFPSKTPRRLQTFADLFCGVGGFHLAAAAHGLQCVFACDIDAPACEVYFSNFGIVAQGDITRIAAEDVPDHDLLCAGFPCQPFSIIGTRAGFADERGTLFFHIVRVLKASSISLGFVSYRVVTHRIIPLVSQTPELIFKRQATRS